MLRVHPTGTLTAETIGVGEVLGPEETDEPEETEETDVTDEPEETDEAIEEAEEWFILAPKANPPHPVDSVSICFSFNTTQSATDELLSC